MTISKFFLYLGAVIAICVSVTWALVQNETKQRNADITGIEKLLEREAQARREAMNALDKQLNIMYEGIRMDIREIRDRLKYNYNNGKP